MEDARKRAWAQEEARLGECSQRTDARVVLMGDGAQERIDRLMVLLADL